MTDNNIFKKWDSSIDVGGFSEDIKEATENGTDSFKEVPHGEYVVAVTQLKLKASKNGDPMVNILFKIVGDSEHKGSLIFFNQVITQGFQIHFVNELIRSMTTEVDNAPSIEFKTYIQYKDLLIDVFEAINDNFKFGLKYISRKKHFSNYEITEVFPLQS